MFTALNPLCCQDSQFEKMYLFRTKSTYRFSGSTYQSLLGQLVHLSRLHPSHHHQTVAIGQHSNSGPQRCGWKVPLTMPKIHMFSRASRETLYTLVHQFTVSSNGLQHPNPPPHAISQPAMNGKMAQHGTITLNQRRVKQRGHLRPHDLLITELTNSQRSHTNPY